MEDLFFFVVGMAVCSSPFLGLGFLIALLRKAKDEEARGRLDVLEADLASLRRHAAQLSAQTLFLKNELEKRTLSATPVETRSELAPLQARATLSLIHI